MSDCRKRGTVIRLCLSFQDFLRIDGESYLLLPINEQNLFFDQVPASSDSVVEADGHSSSLTEIPTRLLDLSQIAWS